MISESNAEMDDAKKLEERSNAFPNFNFEDKLVDGNPKARNKIMIAKHLEYKMVKKYENSKNSFTYIKIKDGKNHCIHLMLIYRQWKLIGEFNAFHDKGIKNQVNRLRT